MSGSEAAATGTGYPSRELGILSPSKAWLELRPQLTKLWTATIFRCIAVDSPLVGMTLDLFHAHLEEPDIRKALLKAGPRLIHVHVADTNRQGLGRGHLDVAACVRALQAIGYSGSVVVEVTPPGPNPFCSIKDDRSPGILDDYIRESLRVLRQHWVESE